MKGSSTLNLRPQEIFSKYEQSIFLVKASSNIDIRPEKPSDTNSADVDSKSVKSDDIPEKLRSPLKTLPEREKPKIFGAYKAGYNLLLENPDSFLIKPAYFFGKFSTSFLIKTIFFSNASWIKRTLV